MRIRPVPLVILMCSLLVPLMPGSAEEIPAQTELGAIGALDQTVQEALAAVVPKPFVPPPDPCPPAGVRVGLVSSGVDLASLPASIQPRFTMLGNGGDPVGYGTFAATQILQLIPCARITSIGIYPGGRFEPTWQAAALDWLVAYAKNFDVVLLAYPPTEFLHPISAAMQRGEWDAMADAISTLGLPGSKGQPTYGLALNQSLRNQQTQNEPYYSRMAMERFAYLMNRWIQAQDQLRKLNAAGVAVVAPAGDNGERPQSIEGLATRPEVITVGSFDGKGVSPSSSSGPSLDGSVKPDLVAPSGLAGVLPPGSYMTKALNAKQLIDSTLKIDWPFAEPPSLARTRIDSSMSSAAVVAAAAGTMAAGGVRDVARVRGALTAASVPLSAPVWRQGAGVLRAMPDASFANSRPLALSHANLGQQPEEGPWTASVAFSGGAPTGATTSITDFIGVGPNGRSTVLQTSSAESPPVAGSVSEQGLKFDVGMGDGRYQGGVYCGYTEVSLPTTGGTVNPTVDVSGLPVGVEQLPTCLIQGTRLTAKSFYIHDTRAENLTFALLPALPVGQSAVDHVLHFLPVDPLATKLWFKVAKPLPLSAKHAKDPGCPSDHIPANMDPDKPCSYAYFPNIPPGYYRIRQFSDYGAPIAQSFTDSTGAQRSSSRDIGERAAYQSFPALVLSAVCATDRTSDSVEGPVTVPTGDECAALLKNTFGPSNVAFEKSTGGYLVDPTGSPSDSKPTTLRVVFDFVKKMPGAGVASRYVDLIECSELNFATFDIGQAISGSGLLNAIPPDLVKAAGLSDLCGKAGLTLNSSVSWYPFNLTTPNYKANMSLNFSYEVNNAYIIVVVIVGNDVSWGVVTPEGQVQLEPGLSNQTINVANLQRQLGLGSQWLRASGKAHFDFHMLPRGASKGHLIFVAVPPANTAIASATIGDLSFELDTWNNTLWPATSFSDGKQGHSFTVSPNMNRDPVKPGVEQIQSPVRCRTNVAGAGGVVLPRMCEDWTVMVHSPGDDAATFDVVHAGSSLLGEMASAGAGYFDPRRGVNDFSHTLVIPTLSILGFEISMRIPFEFKTDGRHWEQLTLPTEVNRNHKAGVEFRIVDNVPGRGVANFPHTPGPVPVPPYMPFQRTATFLSIK